MTPHPSHSRRPASCGAAARNRPKNTIFIIGIALLLCGALFCGAGAVEAHTHDGITFTLWGTSDSHPTNPGNYSLDTDVTLYTTWTVPVGTTNLCLNGHVIKAASHHSVIKVASGATLNLYDCNSGSGGKVTNGRAAFGGGLERRVITQFFGEGGSGKSTLALCAAVSALSQGTGVIYIDTEGFSAERFCQLAGDKAEEYAKSLYVYEPSSFAEQGQVISESERLLRSGKAGLIVLDSATALYRVESGGKDAMARLSQQMMVLLGISRRFDIPAVITNQVFMDIDSHRLTGLGGTALFHISKVIVRIEKHEGFRRAVIVKHRSEAEGKSWDFVLTGTGIRGHLKEE